MMKLRRRPIAYRPFACAVVLGAVAAACATSPLGRKQLMLVDDGSMNQMGAQAFQEIKKETPESQDAATNAYVRCIAAPITQVTGPKTGIKDWEIRVFKSDQVNAFALPGGKIGVYTGLLKVAKTQGQLAAVLGHEVGHVIAKHGAERVSEAQIQGGGMAAVQAFLSGGKQPSATHQLLMAAIGVGSQVAITLPHSRTQESEADLIGEDLMAEAGYDPSESIALWQNMAAAGGGKPPQWLSTHPAESTRIKGLQNRLPTSKPIFDRARAAGKNPSCGAPGAL